MFVIPAWAIGVGFIILVGTIGKIVRGAYSAGEKPLGKHATRELEQAVAELQAKMGGVEEVQRRLADLEERLDFAERMLAQRRGAGRIAPPSPPGRRRPSP